jgi:hypothetical protein
LGSGYAAGGSLLGNGAERNVGGRAMRDWAMQRYNQRNERWAGFFFLVACRCVPAAIFCVPAKNHLEKEERRIGLTPAGRVASISDSLTVAWRETRQGVKVSPFRIFIPRGFPPHLVWFSEILKRISPKPAPQSKPLVRFLFCGHAHHHLS